MTGTETRVGTTQSSFRRVERFDRGGTSRPRAPKEGTKNQVTYGVSLNSSDRLTILYGHPGASKIVLQLLADRALTGQPVVYLDGAHTFDTFFIERLARSRRQSPRKALSLIHVARAFNAWQLERLMSQCLADALERYQASTAVISGLLESLSADCLTDKETNRLTDRMIESLRHLTQQGFSLFCPCPSVPMPQAPAHRLFAVLRTMCDRCIRVHEVEGKVMTEKMSLSANPVYTEPFDIDGGSPSFQSARRATSSVIPIAQLARAAIADTDPMNRLG